MPSGSYSFSTCMYFDRHALLARYCLSSEQTLAHVFEECQPQAHDDLLK